MVEKIKKMCWNCHIAQSNIWRRSKTWKPGESLCNKCGSKEIRGGKPAFFHEDEPKAAGKKEIKAGDQPQAAPEKATSDAAAQPPEPKPAKAAKKAEPKAKKEPKPKAAPAPKEPKAKPPKARKAPVDRKPRASRPIDPVDATRSKECPKCKKLKPMSEFGYRIVPCKDGTKKIDQSNCNACRAAAAKMANVKAKARSGK